MAKKQDAPSRRIPKARHLRRSRQTRDNRAEYNHIIDVLNERKIVLDRLCEAIERLERTAAIQFKRIAQIQVDLDQVRKAWQNADLPSRQRMTQMEAELDEVKKAWQKMKAPM